MIGPGFNDEFKKYIIERETKAKEEKKKKKEEKKDDNRNS